MKSRFALLLIFFLLLMGCKFDFNEQDLLIYKIYRVNDKLIYRNNLGVKDSFMISSKFITNYGWNENTGWFNPPTAKVTIRDLPYNKMTLNVTSGSLNTQRDKELITIYKSEPHGKIKEVLQLKWFIGDIDRPHQQTIELDSLNLGAIFKVPCFDMSTVRDSTDIAYLFWSDTIGIVAYEYKNGDRWILVGREH